VIVRFPHLHALCVGTHLRDAPRREQKGRSACHTQRSSSRLRGHRANADECQCRPFVIHSSFSASMSDNARGVIEPSDTCQSVSSSQARGVIGPSEGGHRANVHERHSMTLVPHWSLLKSIEPKEGGSSDQATRGSPRQLARWVGWLLVPKTPVSPFVKSRVSRCRETRTNISI